MIQRPTRQENPYKSPYEPNNTGPTPHRIGPVTGPRKIIHPTHAPIGPIGGPHNIKRITGPIITRTPTPPTLVTPYNPVETTPPQYVSTPPSGGGGSHPSASGLPPLESLWEDFKNEIEKILTDLKDKVKL
jgi:hypothetical protein